MSKRTYEQFKQNLGEANSHKRGKREFVRGDVVSPRRGNFKGGEYVVHSDNAHEDHVTLNVDGKRVQHPRSNLSSTGRRKRIPGPSPHTPALKAENKARRRTNAKRAATRAATRARNKKSRDTNDEQS